MSFGHMTVIQRPNKLRIAGILAGLLISIPVFTAAFFSGDTFFARASDEIPRDVVTSSIGKTEATVTWTTDRHTQSVIEYGTSPDELTSYAPEVKGNKDHSVDLTFLSSSTTYYFQIRIADKVYDNGGVPWSFTTRSMTGEAPVKQVKGVSTSLSGFPGDKTVKESSTSATMLQCDRTSCENIKAQLGKSCSAEDYLKCIAKGSITPSQNNPGTNYSTPFPTPTTILIVSNYCNMEYLQADNNCSTWTWDNFDTKSYICRESFDRYVLQCKNKSFDGSSSNSDPTTWYFNSAISNIASNSATFAIKPQSGSTVYCQLRVEDEIGGEGHSTRWLRGEKKCD